MTPAPARNLFYRNNLFYAHYGKYHNRNHGTPPMAPGNVDYNVFNADRHQQLPILKYEAHGILDPKLKVNADQSLPAGSKAIDSGADLSKHFGAPLPGCPSQYFAGKAPDMGEPFTLPAGSTIMDMATAIHRQLAENLKFARIWGEGVYDGQNAPRNHILHDRDIVELHFD